MSAKTYKKIDLFGNEQVCFVENRPKPPKNLFTDHEAFVDKFKAKLTTDDCYTPKAVFDAVLNFAAENCDIAGCEILRPFMPEGDYKNIEYGANCVVIDNPPFSIMAEILKFYISKNIKFFLFAPHLTLFSSNFDYTSIVVGANVIYENGASVNTSFVSNMFEDVRILGAPNLLKQLEAINEANKVNLPKYTYPEQVATVSQIQKIVASGLPVKILKEDCTHCRVLDSQKAHKKAIFGSGFLLSEKAALEKAALEKAALEKAALEKAALEKAALEKVALEKVATKDVIVWELSKKELQVIKNLGK